MFYYFWVTWIWISICHQLDDINQLFLPHMRNKLLWYYQDVEEVEQRPQPEGTKPRQQGQGKPPPPLVSWICRFEIPNVPEVKIYPYKYFMIWWLAHFCNTRRHRKTRYLCNNKTNKLIARRCKNGYDSHPIIFPNHLIGWGEQCFLSKCCFSI